jgi:hypothetical protein
MCIIGARIEPCRFPHEDRTRSVHAAAARQHQLGKHPPRARGVANFSLGTAFHGNATRQWLRGGPVECMGSMKRNSAFWTCHERTPRSSGRVTATVAPSCRASGNIRNSEVLERHPPAQCHSDQPTFPTFRAQPESNHPEGVMHVTFRGSDPWVFAWPVGTSVSARATVHSHAMPRVPVNVLLRTPAVIHLRTR